LTTVDCSKTIWILATNALDGTIKRFCALNEKAIFVDGNNADKAVLMKRLAKELKTDFLRRFNVSRLERNF